MTSNSTVGTILEEADWRMRRSAHVARLKPYADDRIERMRRSVKHPINDFLFEYYPFRPAHLLRWSPGANAVLKGAQPGDTDWPREFEAVEDGAMISSESLSDRLIAYLDWAIGYLEETGGRAPHWNCFGLHEWAMLYRTDQARHSTPLRLAAAEIAGVVDELGLRCTHYDAYRFFTPDAAPMNRIPLSRATTAEHDQPACIHATMDLYKYAFKIAPWIASETVGDAFLLAWKARQTDMRASPYDFRPYGLEPIRIETKEGREEYLEAQRALERDARPIRTSLLLAYRNLRALKSSAIPHPD